MATEREEVNAFEEIVEFLLSSPTLEQFATLRPSPKLDKRINYLLDANGEGTITPEEIEELDEFLVLDALMSLLKVRAMIRLRDESP